MKPVVFLIFLIGVGAMIQRTVDFSSEESSFSAIAVNYAIYRNKVFRYVYEHNGLSGDIPLAVLDLPESWRALRNWRARVDAGRCYVYGDASMQEITAVRQLFRGSFALGMASNGRLIPVMGNVITVPAFIPNGSLVSVTEIDR